MSRQIKVLVVDDSSLVRKIITDILESDPEIKVVGTANNGKTAVFRANELDPDVITMDIEMPIMDGLTALQEIVRTNPKPVIMMSVLTQHGAEATFKALDYGAVDFVPKPSSVVNLSVDEIGDQLIGKVKSFAGARVRVGASTLSREAQAASYAPRIVRPSGSVKTAKKIVAIGTSTGGPSALLSVFQAFPKDFTVPIVVVQHMPEGFTKAFSERLNNSSNLFVKEAEDGDVLELGHAYIAPGHSHVAVAKNNSGYYLKVYSGEKVSGHRPSIDVLFQSVAQIYERDALAVIMTGMGRDGATGIHAVRDKGGFTLAQDEATSVVFGMNRVAIQEGGIDKIVPLEQITKKIVEYIVNGDNA